MKYSQKKIQKIKATPPAANAKIVPGVQASRPPTNIASREVLIDALSPLVIRSGRPFDDQSGVDDARLPPPSTLAGALRTGYARQQGLLLGRALLDYAVEGPLLCRGSTLLVPKPADALYFGQGEDAKLVRSAPQAPRHGDGCGSDLPAGLLLLQLERDDIKGKPGTGPAWWALEDWLKFRRGNSLTHADIKKSGWTPPAGENRTHVAIDNNRLAAASGKLFQTAGLDLGATLDDKGNNQMAVQLLMRFAEPLAPGVIALGGERRLAVLNPQADTKWPTPPQGWFEDVLIKKGLSLTLVTAGLFAHGYRPGWLNAEGVGCVPNVPDVLLKLRAVACERWQAHSGWDLAKQQPKATRKLVPPGAVYWFEIVQPQTLTVEQLQALWLSSLCDAPQDRRDGFGLALPAAWQPVY